MKEYEKILKALANRRRIEIIRYLKENKYASVGVLASHLKLSFKSTSKHLAVLLAADIVEKEQKSLTMFYSLVPKQHTIVKNLLSIL